MEEESPNLRKASHIGLWIMVILIGGWLVWSATHTRTMNKTDTFATGSKQSNIYHITKNYALASLNLALLPLQIHGCTSADKLENEPEQATNEAVDAKVVINAAVNDKS